MTVLGGRGRGRLVLVLLPWRLLGISLLAFPSSRHSTWKFEGFKRFAKVWSLFQAQLRSKFLSQLPTGHKRNFFGEIIFGKLP
jgi:hypothetical protein